MSRGRATTPTLRRLARALISVVVTVGLLALIVRRLDGAELASIWSTVDLRWTLVVMALVPLQVVLSGLRWRAICASLGLPMAKREAVEEVGLSTLLNQLLPGGLAGDALRVWRQAGAATAVPVALRAAMIDRGVGLWVHVVVTLVGCGLAVRIGHIAAREAALVVGVGLALSALPLVRNRFGGEVRAVLRETGPFVIGSSFVLTCSFLLSFAAAGAAVGVAPGAWVVTGVPLILFAMSVPLSVGGWGLREATAVLLLPRMGFTAEAALAASAVYGLANLVGIVPGGWPLLRGTLR